MADPSIALHITALDDNFYRITAQTPAGEFTTDRHTPFEKTQVREVLTLLAEGDTSNEQSQAKIRTFGEKLFHFLIGDQPDILQGYRNTLGRAGKNRLFVRICSEQAGRLAALPWEALCDRTEGFLALSPKTPIIRYKPELAPCPPAPLISPLRVLVVIPSPPNYPRLHVEKEWQRLSTAVGDLQTTGQIQLERLEEATWPALRRQVRAEDYAVIHYIGYTHFDEATQQGFLALDDDHNVSGSRTVSAAELGGELGAPSTVRLCVLNTRRDPSDPQSKAPNALGYQLLQAGMPGIITTQFSLSKQAETALNTALYQPLCEGHPVEAALNVARRAMAEHTASLDWLKIALFLRAHDGQLFHSVLER